MTRQAAFLRGINVGGHTVRMTNLRECFMALGFSDVKTILSTGNVIFSGSTSTPKLTEMIRQQLKEWFGWDILAILRPLDELQEMIYKNPFERILITPATRLYVTFLEDKPDRAPKTPVMPPHTTFTVLDVGEREIYSVLTLSPGCGTPELMAYLSQQFGKNITTRNWDTLKKIAVQ